MLQDKIMCSVGSTYTGMAHSRKFYCTRLILATEEQTKNCVVQGTASAKKTSGQYIQWHDFREWVFKEYFHISLYIFHLLLDKIVGPMIKEQYTRLREAISPGARLEATILYLINYRTTVCNLFRTTSTFIWGCVPLSSSATFIRAISLTFLFL